ncbi:ABC transporter permease [Ramlibacter henchirensis]|uniref:Transport permease protein n=1 Tax=Ramlibacter henchirensis TaxID=204072 RepID=A0A4Z0C0U7_9BURK|nr:ABC transporter permease [Ramlibacter henchirensis]TFZ05156.1 ABC transporter permease [Ramlibacter henchirensis]
MNPHARQGRSPAALVHAVWKHRALVRTLAVREIRGRYQGSMGGMLWSVAVPLLMLAIYTFVFSVVFKARWDQGASAADDRTAHAFMLFAGLIVHGLFAEVISRAPQLIPSNPNFVKKVVFPLETLPIVCVLAAVFQAVVSLVILLAAQLIFTGRLQPSAVYVIPVLLPFVVLTTGAAWILCSIGVFVRDLAQLTGIIAMLAMFMSPVFFPLSALPANLQPWMMANPLTFVIEQTRTVLLLGGQPHWPALALYSLLACLVAWLGFACFQLARRKFADVL